MAKLSKQEALIAGIEQGIFPDDTTLETMGQAARNYKAQKEAMVSNKNNSRGFLDQVTNLSPQQFGQTTFPSAGEGLQNLGNIGRGAYDAFRNNLTNAANIAPGVNIAPSQSGEGPAYEFGGGLGEIGSFLAGGELLKGLQGAAKGLPYVGKVAQALEGGKLQDMLRRGIGSAIYGYGTNPENREREALLGAGLSGILDAVPMVGALAKPLREKIRPAKHARELMQELGGGQSLDQNAKSLANDIKKAYERRVEEGHELYNPVFDNLGGSYLYSPDRQIESNYSLIPQKILKKDLEVRELNKTFAENPTLKNAHDLQSQLGTVVRRLKAEGKRNGLGTAGHNALIGFGRAQDAIQKDIHSFLSSSENPNLSNKYYEATENWKNNVVPYIENPGIREIAKGDIENPGTIMSIFERPEKNTLRVIEDMGPSASNKIIYSEIGKIRKNFTPESLVNAMDRLEAKGLGAYLSEDLISKIADMHQKINARNLAQRGAGMLGGAILGGGFTPVGAGLAAAGAAINPAIIAKIGKIPGAEAAAEFLQKALKKGYSPLATTIKATSIPANNSKRKQ